MRTAKFGVLKINNNFRRCIFICLPENSVYININTNTWIFIYLHIDFYKFIGIFFHPIRNYFKTSLGNSFGAKFELNRTPGTNRGKTTVPRWKPFGLSLKASKESYDDRLHTTRRGKKQMSCAFGSKQTRKTDTKRMSTTINTMVTIRIHRLFNVNFINGSFIFFVLRIIIVSPPHSPPLPAW